MNTLHILGKTRKISCSNIKMLVFDMAGTTVNEHGIVYDTIFETLSKFGVGVSPREIEKWQFQEGPEGHLNLGHFCY